MNTHRVKDKQTYRHEHIHGYRCTNGYTWTNTDIAEKRNMH